MARLTAKARRALPKSTFAGPGRSFPIPDKGHAHAALGLIGHAPPSARPKIRARAEAMLHKGNEEHHEEGGLAPGGHYGGTHGDPNWHEHHPHVHKPAVHEHHSQHDIQMHHMAPEPRHSEFVPGDEGPEGEHYTERHELHHKAHPGESGYRGREGNKTIMRRSQRPTCSRDTAAVPGLHAPLAADPAVLRGAPEGDRRCHQ
jgi:hypothetical protein